MKTTSKRLLIGLLSLAMAASMTACTNGGSSASSSADGTASQASDSGKPDTWIADREITVQSFIDDQGLSLPSDMKNNPIAQELKKRTGMSINVIYVSGNNDLEVLTTSLAAGDLPDAIDFYLNDSTRPEFPVLLKAAREGMFTDVAPLLKDTKVYKKYLEDGFLPEDSKTNVMFRPEFNGACYLIHMNVPRSEKVGEENRLRGGMWIQKSIAEDLNVDITSVKTEDDLYNLLKQIKAKNYTDANGNPIYPLGPSVWGGRYLANEVLNNYNFGLSSGFNLLDGKVMHESETDYVYKQIEFYQKLFKEELINPEMFTLDPSRANELSLNLSSGIMADNHNFMLVSTGQADDPANVSSKYLPLGDNLTDYAGRTVTWSKAKSCYGGIAIPATTKKPEEVLKLFDYLASKEGKLLWMYGIEGTDYTLDSNGFPQITDSAYERSLNTDAEKEYGLPGTGGSLWLNFLGATDMDNMADFGETSYGESRNVEKTKQALDLYNTNPIHLQYYEGFDANAYLSDLPEVEAKLQALVKMDKYEEVKEQAILSGNMDEARKIIETYVKQLKDNGLDEFKAHLQEIYDKNPKAISFR